MLANFVCTLRGERATWEHRFIACSATWLICSNIIVAAGSSWKLQESTGLVVDSQGDQLYQQCFFCLILRHTLVGVFTVYRGATTTGTEVSQTVWISLTMTLSNRVEWPVILLVPFTQNGEICCWCFCVSKAIDRVNDTRWHIKMERETGESGIKVKGISQVWAFAPGKVWDDTCRQKGGRGQALLGDKPHLACVPKLYSPQWL